jgi:hypothetical protein
VGGWEGDFYFSVGEALVLAVSVVVLEEYNLQGKASLPSRGARALDIFTPFVLG